MSRFDYVKYDDKAAGSQDFFKRQVTVLELGLNSLPDSREKSLAMTKIEEAYMWIGKAIRDDQIKRNGSAPLQEERKNG
jgi:hypothetical protein